MEKYHKKHLNNTLTLKYVRWILDNNPHILDILITAFRFVLSMLEVEGAQDYTGVLNIREAIVNILEYFDLSYRSFDFFILFYQENILLGLTQDSLILASYSQDTESTCSPKVQATKE